MGNPAPQKETAELWLLDISSGKAFALFDGFTVGRAGGDVQILDPSVSAKHCIFHLKGKVLEIEDVGSRNGTFVGGLRIEPKRPLALLPGVTIEVGNRSFEVQATSEPVKTFPSLEIVSTAMQMETSSGSAPVGGNSGGNWSTAAVPSAVPFDRGSRLASVTVTATMPTQRPPTAKAPVRPSYNGVLVVIAATLVVLGAIAAWFCVHY